MSYLGIHTFTINYLSCSAEMLNVSFTNTGQNTLEQTSNKKYCSGHSRLLRENGKLNKDSGWTTGFMF